MSWQTTLCGCICSGSGVPSISHLHGSPPLWPSFTSKDSVIRELSSWWAELGSTQMSQCLQRAPSTWNVFTCWSKISSESFWMNFTSSCDFFSPLFLLNNSNTLQTSYLLITRCIYSGFCLLLNVIDYTKDSQQLVHSWFSNIHRTTKCCHGSANQQQQQQKPFTLGI